MINENENYLINSDNLLALKQMMPDIKGKVDSIYIDPPYNTGKRMGKYNDNFGSTKNYIDFLRPRIILGKETLVEGGCMFVSIGERMQAHMKIMLEEIFGAKNHVATIIWVNKYTIANDKKGMTGKNEYIYVFTNNYKAISINRDPLRPEYVSKVYKNPDNDPRGLWRGGVQMHKEKNPESCRFEVVSPTGKVWSKKWNFTKSSWDALAAAGRIYWGVNGDAQPMKKVYLKETKGLGIHNIWDGEDFGYTSDGTSDLKKILNIEFSGFLYPKPISLIKRIIQITMPKDRDGLLLDFFAGSGSTAQALEEWNKEEGANHNFILVTNNEDNICESITKPRIEAANAVFKYKVLD